MTATEVVVACARSVMASSGPAGPAIVSLAVEIPVRNALAGPATAGYASGSGSKLSDAELMQYRKPVGSGPSSKTCPRCAWQFAQ